MGTAIIEGALRSGLLQASQVTAVDREQSRCDCMAALGCHTATDTAALAKCTTVLLAVRPQDFGAIGDALCSTQDQLAVSVMAGLASQTIATALGPNTRVVRTMPNTAASIGKAVTGIAAGPGATEADLAVATDLLESVGCTVAVDEDQMHAVTAVSGSGPAYLYLLAEAIETEARVLGLRDDQVNDLLRGMVLGAATLFDGDDRTPAQLRAAVTTPGGTTEAGLAVMIDAGFVEAARAGVRAACARGEALA